MTFPEFLSQRLGPKWAIVRRRTAAARDRWGANLILKREYDAVKAEFVRLYGELYLVRGAHP